MAEFSKLVITDVGRALLAKMISGSGNIEFTNVSASGAEYTDAELGGLTSLSDVKQTSRISKVTRTNETAVKVEAAFTNKGLTEGYYIKALGLYAVDPDAGEILYAVTRETSGNCHMPAYNGVTVSGAYVQLVTTVGNAENVSLEVDSGAYATMGDIRSLETRIGELNEQMDKCFGDIDISGDIGFDEGIKADNIVDAINEVFTLGSEKKNKLVENLTAMGIDASTDETWEALLGKVLDMTDTSRDTVTAAALLDGYTAHDAAGKQITGEMPEQAGATVDATEVMQDEEYTYLGVPAGHYDESSKVRAINSDISYKLHIPEIRLQTYGAGGTPNNSTRFILPVEKFAKMTIGKRLGETKIYSVTPKKLSGGGGMFDAEGNPINLSTTKELEPTNGIYDLSDVNGIAFVLSLGAYSNGAPLDVDWSDKGSWAKSAFEDIYLY